MAKKDYEEKISDSPVKKKQIKISFEKFIQLYASHIHIYSVAYLRPIYSDIIKTRQEWDAELIKQGVK